MNELQVVTNDGRVFVQDLKPSEATDTVLRIFRIGYYTSTDGEKRIYVPVSNITHVIVAPKIVAPKPEPVELVND